MEYVFDTGILSRIMEHYYISTFPSFWEKLHEYIAKKKIISVKEVKKELESWGGLESNVQNTLLSPLTFEGPAEEELIFIREIFSCNKQYEDLINKKNRLSGNPSADPYLIAKAKICDYVIVTTETHKGYIRDKHKKVNIPSVCKDFDIKYYNLEEFMRKENWNF